MYTANKTRTKRKTRRPINIHQNKFDKGYISVQANSRMFQNALSDTTNIEIVQDSVPRPRPPLVLYGTQPAYPIIGRGKYTKNRIRYEIFMMNVSGVGKVYTRTDGGAFTLIGGTYDAAAWAGFTQSNNKVYIFNGVNKASYLNLATDTLVTYTALTTLTAPTATKAGLAGTTYTYYYKVTANNDVGESAASASGTVTVGKIRDLWNSTTDNVTVTWTTVAGATSYTVYVGDSTSNIKKLATVTGLSYLDDGTLVPDPFTVAPAGNSTDGPVFIWMYNDARNSQLFGIDAANKFWYAAAGTGDFSPYNGGGYAPIDENGDTLLNYVDGFRDGKGSSVITLSSRGAAGKGKLFHVTFNTLTYGEQIIIYPNIYEANGQSGTYSARAVIKARDSLYYPTGDAFKSTGTSQNIVNILTTNSISQVIQPDVDLLNLSALSKAVGVEYQDKLFWALPVNASENNQIWYLDLARKNLWVLKWDVAAKDMWLYEDSSGLTHFCVLVNDAILEFTRLGSSSTTDNGVSFPTRVGFESLVWDEDGLVMANIRKMYFKLLFPTGNIQANAYGLDADGVTQTLATGNLSVSGSVSFTGIGQWDYSGKYKYGDSVGAITSYAKSVGVIPLKTNAKLINQLNWEVVTENANCDYFLAAVNTKGNTNDNRIFGE